MEFKIEFGVLKKTTGNDRIIVVPEGVREIAFYGLHLTHSVDEIIFPSSLRQISGNAVNGEKNVVVKKITFKEGCEILLNGAININAVEIYLPSSLKYIEHGNFTPFVDINRLRILKFGNIYGWNIMGANKVYNHIQFSLCDPYSNADYFTGRKNPQGAYGLQFYDLKRY